MIQTKDFYLFNNDGILLNKYEGLQEGIKIIDKTITQEDIIKINKGWILNIETEEFEETEESKEFEKQALISQYKTNLDSIKEISAEMSEVETTKQYFPEIAEKRLEILTEKRTTLREANGKLVAEGVSKFGEEILNQI